MTFFDVDARMLDQYYKFDPDLPGLHRKYLDAILFKYGSIDEGQYCKGKSGEWEKV